MELKLASPPSDDRNREFWLQHATGYIFFRDMKDYAVSNIESDVDQQTKEKIVKGIEDAIYGLMMIMDGVVGTIQNDEYAVRIEANILLEKHGQVMEKINTLDGDGMCMGFHDWQAGDFGEDSITN